MDNTQRRWDTDEIGTGIADGSVFAPEVQALLAAMASEGWVAEDPDIHLLPHLERACHESIGGRLAVLSAQLEESIDRVELRWSSPNRELRQLRGDVFALIGSVAERATFVRQYVSEDRVRFDVVTGMLDGDGPFASHGHLIRFEVRRREDE